MALKNLRETLQDSLLQLPIGGKTYTVPEASVETWLWLKVIYDRAPKPGQDQPEGDAEAEDLANTPETEMHKRVLGPVYDEMAADGVSMREVRIAGMTASIDTMYGREIAEDYFNAGGNWGNLQALTETQGETTDTPPTAAPSTRTRASRNGATAKTATATRGKTASNTGS